MSDLEVRIVKLDPMRVASVRVVSETPEVDAWGGADAASTSIAAEIWRRSDWSA